MLKFGLCRLKGFCRVLLARDCIGRILLFTIIGSRTYELYLTAAQQVDWITFRRLRSEIL